MVENYEDLDPHERIQEESLSCEMCATQRGRIATGELGNHVERLCADHQAKRRRIWAKANSDSSTQLRRDEEHALKVLVSELEERIDKHERASVRLSSDFRVCCDGLLRQIKWLLFQSGSSRGKA